MKISHQRGIYWALGTVFISGVSVYVNKFGVAQLSDPFVYTTLKNTVVTIGFVAILGLLPGSWRELRIFTPHQWVGWLGLGLMGGGIPFLLFFGGLTNTSAPSAALIHKTLFLWVALLAVPLLGERLGWWQIAGLGVLAVGQFLLQPPSAWGWGSGETMMLMATLLWACETILAKKVLLEISPHTAVLGRMGVGAMVMWLFLSFTGRAGTPLALTGTQWFWVLVTSIFLMGYVWTWYRALKAAPAVLVSSVLTLSAIITILLNGVVDGQATATLPAMGMLLLMAGAIAIISRPHQPVSQATAVQ